MSTHVLTFDHAEGELPICSKCRAPIDAATWLSDAVCPGEPQGCRPPFAHVFRGQARCQCGAEGWDAVGEGVLMTCEFCGEESATVRTRPRYGEEPMALCPDCWGDLQEVTRPARQEP